MSKCRTGWIALESFLEIPKITSAISLGMSGCFCGRTSFFMIGFLVILASPSAPSNAVLLLNVTNSIPSSVLLGISSYIMVSNELILKSVLNEA